MSAVRLPLMTLSEMLKVVRPSGLLTPDDLLDAIQTRSESRDMDLNYRGMLSAFTSLCLSVCRYIDQKRDIPFGVRTKLHFKSDFIYIETTLNSSLP